jgi:endonuclease/exonuclease/phosphatase family metal-dependent hydrolase
MGLFTLMNWNVENLFLPEDGAEQAELQRFQRKLDLLAGTIAFVQPTVLALQEIGSSDALTALQTALEQADSPHAMPHDAIGDPDDRGIRVAFLSTLPLQAIIKLRPFPEAIQPVQSRDSIFDDQTTPDLDESSTKRMGRGALEVRIDVDGTPVTLITAHFKSKLIQYPRQRGVVAGSRFSPNDENERYRYGAYGLFRRTGEAVTIRDRLNALLSPDGQPASLDSGLGKDKAVIFCGDLNDEVEAATTQLIQGPGGSEIGTAGFRTPDRGNGYRLWNLAPLLNRGPNGEPPSKPPFSRRYRDRSELIDHVFVSRRLVDPQQLPVARTLMATGRLPSVDDQPVARRDDSASDHAALVATFQL